VGLSASFLGATPAGQRLGPLNLFARLLIEGCVAEVDVPVQARVRVVLILGCCVEGIARWRYSLLVHISSLGCVGRAPGEGRSPRGHLYVMRLLSHLLWLNAIVIRYNPPMKLSRLKEHRERRGLTQMELAKLSDVGRATIAAIETGKRPRPHPPTRERLAKALKVKPEDLV
jgi:DNA-binding XRE family transcriptional regulator